MTNFRGVLSKYALELENYLVDTDSLPVIVIDKDLTISAYNHCFEKTISSNRDLTGEPLESVLLPESHKMLPLTENIKSKATLLNFMSQDSSPVPLYCHIVKVEEEKHLIFGGRLMLTNDETLQRMTLLSNELANMTRDLHQKNTELREAQSKIKILSGIIPICSYCKEIRDDKGYWNKLEQFISEHSEAEFSHGICDKCMDIHFPDD